MNILTFNVLIFIGTAIVSTVATARLLRRLDGDFDAAKGQEDALKFGDS